MDRKTSTITLTFGDQAENHVGMQKIGKMAEHGFSIKELEKAKLKFEKNGLQCELICLNEYLPDGWSPNCDVTSTILIVRNGVSGFFDDDDMTSECVATDMFKEQSTLDTDKKAFMYGRVVNKHARHNLCFSDIDQDPDYENQKGRIVAFDHVPLMSAVRNGLPFYFGKKAANLAVEGNYYYDTKKCGIGFHGDSERRIVIAVRLGCSIPLHYQWFYNSKPIGDRVKLILNHGDMYAMSEKAVGTDWKSKKISTLRHAAGATSFLAIKTK